MADHNAARAIVEPSMTPCEVKIEAAKLALPLLVERRRDEGPGDAPDPSTQLVSAAR